MTKPVRETDQKVAPDRRSSTGAGKAKHRVKSDRRFGFIEVVVFLIGLALFLYPLAAAYLNYAETTQAVDEYENIVNQLTPQQRQKMWQDAKQYDDDLGKPTLRDPFRYKEIQEPLGRYSKILNVDGKGMMAYVDIPKINVKLPIRHGTTDEVLRDSIGHIATTHVPTDNSTIHSVITGHTGEVGHILFDNLTQMKKGDVFQIRVLDKRMSYQVDQIKVILPTEVDDLQPVAGSNYVTMLTCTPYGINSHRLLIRGRFIGENVPATKPQGAPNYMLWILLLLMILCLLAWYYLSRRRKECKQHIANLDKIEAGGGQDHAAKGVYGADDDGSAGGSDGSFGDDGPVMDGDPPDGDSGGWRPDLPGVEQGYARSQEVHHDG